MPHITDIDTDIRHAHDLGLLRIIGRPQDWTLLQLEVDPVRVAHEHKPVTRSTIGLA